MSAVMESDGNILSSEARETLTRNAEILRKSPGLRVQIEGHCDERGSEAYNLALGEKRAGSAMKYLTTLGLSAERLSTISYGEEKAAVEGHDEAAWSKNRRVEFVVLTEQGE